MIQFKKIEVTQIPLLQQLATKIWTDNYSQMISKEQLAYMLNLMYNTSLLTKEINSSQYIWNFITWNHKEIGYFCCKREEEKLFLSKLYLDISVQGKGIAQQTLSHIKQISQQENFPCIYLTVNKTNQKGIKAYEKFGFKKTKSMTSEIGNGFVMDDFIYQYDM